MRLGWIKGLLTVGLPVGVSLALSGCSTVTGAVDGLGRQISAIVGLVSPDQSELEVADIDKEADTSADRRAGANIASQRTKRLFWPKARESAPSSTSSSSEEIEQAETSPQNSATTTGQGGPKIELAAVASSAPTRNDNVPRFRVQVAAVHDKADAHQAWERAQTDYGVVLAGMEPIVVRAETSNGIIYRVQTGPFQTRSEADRFCARLRELGAICFVAAA